VNAWNGGFVATVKVTAGGSAINGWNVAMNLGGSTVTSSWNTTRTGTGGTVQFANVSYNGRLNAAGSTEFGFQGTGSAPSGTPSCTAS
jgi:endo-1,4-beta-xylanase